MLIRQPVTIVVELVATDFQGRFYRSFADIPLSTGASLLSCTTNTHVDLPPEAAVTSPCLSILASRRAAIVDLAIAIIVEFVAADLFALAVADTGAFAACPTRRTISIDLASWSFAVFFIHRTVTIVVLLVSTDLSAAFFEAGAFGADVIGRTISIFPTGRCGTGLFVHLTVAILIQIVVTEFRAGILLTDTKTPLAVGHAVLNATFADADILSPDRPGVTSTTLPR